MLKITHSDDYETLIIKCQYYCSRFNWENNIHSIEGAICQHVPTGIKNEIIDIFNAAAKTMEYDNYSELDYPKNCSYDDLFKFFQYAIKISKYYSFI